MFNIICKYIMVLILFTHSSLILAAGVTDAEISKAQGEMLSRIYNIAEKYASRIKIDHTYIGYCIHEIHLHTYDHPSNGYIPFGANYNTIKNKKSLESIISSREAYETAFMKLCLADIKNKLSRAEP